MSNEREFSQFYEKYSDKIFRYLYFQTKNFDLAEDLTSEVFTKAWEVWGNIRHDNLLEKIQRDEEANLLARALEVLPEKLKRVAILRFIEGLSAKEVAVILEVSEVNVRVLQHRALVKLKEEMKDGRE